MTDSFGRIMELLSKHIPPSIQLRAELEKMVRFDLLGPADDPHEEIEDRMYVPTNIVVLVKNLSKRNGKWKKSIPARPITSN
jgi:hypothetical protein